MTHVLAVQKSMRVFTPNHPGAKLMYPNGTALFKGDEVDVESAIFVMSFDHRTKLALQLKEEKDTLYYVLVHDLSKNVFGLANAWSFAYEEQVVAKDASARKRADEELVSICSQLEPLLRKYLRPKLYVVVSGEDRPEPKGEREGQYILPTL